MHVKNTRNWAEILGETLRPSVLRAHVRSTLAVSPRIQSPFDLEDMLGLATIIPLSFVDIINMR